MKIFIILIFVLSSCIGGYAQELRVKKSPDRGKVNREVTDGVASIIFESNIKELRISNDTDDERINLGDGTTIFLIEPESEEYIKELGYPKRSYILKTPNTSECILKIEDILPSNVYYYTITLPNKFPLSLTTEYLFSKSSTYGFRLSIGKQIGGFVSYRWGKYKASGNSIDKVTSDGDLSHAKYLGRIREAITGGIRVGLLYNDVWITKLGLNLLVGGGYGKYGRQWQNPTELEGNIYFYSDYIEGFNADLSLQCTLGDWIVLSAGADAIISKGRTSFDYLLGIGVNLNFTKMLKRKLK